MSNTKRITMKYWDSLSVESRYNALRKVFSHFPDSVNRAYAKEKAKTLTWIWEIVVKHVKQPVGHNTTYHTVIDNTWLP